MSHSDWKIKYSFLPLDWWWWWSSIVVTKLWPCNITSLRSILISNMNLSESSPTITDICRHRHHGSSGVLFSSRYPFLHRDREILANFGYFVADLRTSWYSYRAKWCGGALKLTNIRVIANLFINIFLIVSSVFLSLRCLILLSLLSFVDSIAVSLFGSMTVDTGELLINIKY